MAEWSQVRRYTQIGIHQLSVTELFDTILSNITVSDGENEYGLMLILYKVSIPENTTIVLGEGETFEWVSPDTAGERIANKYSEEFRAKLATL